MSKDKYGHFIPEPTDKFKKDDKIWIILQSGETEGKFNKYLDKYKNTASVYNIYRPGEIQIDRELLYPRNNPLTADDKEHIKDMYIAYYVNEESDSEYDDDVQALNEYRKIIK